MRTCPAKNARRHARRQVSAIHWHLKRIYRKLGLTRQAELGHLVRAITDFA